MINELETQLWDRELENLLLRVGVHFGRVEPRRRMRDYVRGLLGPVGRKNGWQLAEYAGHATPDGLQHLLARARWDADEIRDELQYYVAERLGEDDGVLIIDDTGFIKKGTTSAGVQRQYSGTAGRTENCQIGVFTAYASARGRALVDRELYLPKSWTEDRDRCRAAKIPDEQDFRTKGSLAKALILRALASPLPVGWVTADSAYGQEGRFRRLLEQSGVGYVLAVPKSQFSVGCPRIDWLFAQAPAEAWQRISCGDGAKGPRVYDWAAIQLPAVAEFDYQGEDLVRRRWALARFPAGTMVLMGDGRSRPIETLHAGDRVRATDPVTGATGSREVTATILTPDDRDFTERRRCGCGITWTGSSQTATSRSGIPLTGAGACRRRGWRWCRCRSTRRTSPTGRPPRPSGVVWTGNYCLGLELDDPGFDFSVLSEFRDRMAEGDRADRLLAVMVDRLAEAGLVKRRGRQRTDSTHVLASVRRLDRIELVGETLRAALEQLTAADEDWVSALVTDGWARRYGRPVRYERLPRETKEREQYAVTVGEDGMLLFRALLAADAPARLRQLPQVEVLRQVWVQQYWYDEEGALRWRGPKQTRDRLSRRHSPRRSMSAAAAGGSPDPATATVPWASAEIVSPHDPQARFSHKPGKAE